MPYILPAHTDYITQIMIDEYQLSSAESNLVITDKNIIIIFYKYMDRVDSCTDRAKEQRRATSQ